MTKDVVVTATQTSQRVRRIRNVQPSKVQSNIPCSCTDLPHGIATGFGANILLPLFLFLHDMFMLCIIFIDLVSLLWHRIVLFELSSI